MTKTYADMCLERASKATEGPWGTVTYDGLNVIAKNNGLVCEVNRQFIPNARFIAHSRTDVVELATRLKRACEIIHDEFCSQRCHPYHLELEAMPEEK